MSLAGVALCLASQAGEGAVAREWSVRSRALEPAVHAAELTRELASPVWRERLDALEVLFRAAEVQRPWSAALEGVAEEAALEEAVRAALADPHPNVRARALAALGARASPLRAEVAARLGADAVGSVRLALARALEHAPAPGRAGLLATLSGDPDERVRDAARLALLGLEEGEEGVRAARLAVLARVRAEGRGPLARFLLALARSSLAEASLPEARALLAEDAAALGLLEALAFARFGRGQAGPLVACARADEAWDAAGARLFELAARARSPALAAALLAGLAELEEGVARRGLVGLLLETLEPGAPGFLAAHDLAGALLVECLEGLALRRDHWRDEEWAPWTRPAAAPEVRRACQRALAGAYSRASDPGAGRGLLVLLADGEPEIARAAFEALCAARAPGVDDGAALLAAYAPLSASEKLRRTSAFTRERVFAPFRGEWLALGAAGDEARATACELLAGFESDPAAGAALAGWLAADRARFAAGASELAQLVQAELRALARVSRGAATAEFLATLEASLGRSTEVGKVAAAALGRSADGRAALARLLGAGALAAEADRRTRIEACLLLARAPEADPRPPAVAQLLVDRPCAAWDLRQRVLAALADSGVPAAEDALLALLDATAVEPVERMAAATLLAACCGARAGDALAALARSRHDLESRRVAVAALAGLGQGAELARLAEELAAGRLAGSADELALLGHDLVLARARLDPAPWVCSEWLRAPRARAAADLARRFLGEELPAPEFTWRHELELARILAPAGTLETCLARADGLERLDARALLALGEVALREGREAAAEPLYVRATIGLLGERDPDPGQLAWLAARRLGLARARGPREVADRLEVRVRAARRAGELTDAQWETLSGPEPEPPR